MKFVRFLLWGAAAFAALLIIIVAVAFTSGFQTWAARKAIASQPGLDASVGKVSISLGKVSLSDLKLAQDGIEVRMPALDIDIPLVDAARKDIRVEKIVARDWVVDLTKAKMLLPSAAAAPDQPAMPAKKEVPAASKMSASPAQLEAIKTAFSGLFPLLVLPVDLSVADADIQGTVVLPGQKDPIKIQVKLAGGHLKAGQEGKFDVQVNADLGKNAPVQTLQVKGAVLLGMNTPKSFSKIGTQLTAEAKGTQVPQGATLQFALKAEKSAQGESYVVQIEGADKTLLSLKADLPQAKPELRGTWAVNVSERDLSAFSLGLQLPTFKASGEGSFVSDLKGESQLLNGQFRASCDSLAVVSKELAAIGAINLSTEFDLLHQGSVIRVTQLKAELAGMRPVLAFHALQGFELDIQSRELKVADPSKELALLDVAGLPLAWAQPYLKDINLSGGDLSGAYALRASSGGFALRATRPLTISGIQLSQNGTALLKGIDFSMTFGADYTPKGWQAEIADLSIRQGPGTLVSLVARAGQLTGDKQPIKVQGQWKADLPAVLAQPALASLGGTLAKGKAQGEFSANVADKIEVSSRAELTELLAPKVQAELLPETKIDLRADIASDGSIKVQAPVLISNARKQRSSDLTLSGTVKPGASILSMDVSIASQLLALEDLQILAAPFAASEPAPVKPVAKPSITPRPGQAVTTQSTADTEPVWKGLEGQVLLSLKKVVLNDTFAVSEINGTLKISGSAVQVDAVKAVLNDAGSLAFDANLGFAPSKEPYSMKAQLTVIDFDTKGLLGGTGIVNPSLEAKFNVSSNLVGTGKNLADLAQKTTGKFDFISKGGNFRLLRTDISDMLQQKSSSGLGGLVSAGIGLLGGGKNSDSKDMSKLDEYMKMAADISEYCANIRFDQLSVVVTRDQQLDIHLQDFALISPLVRLTGTGEIKHAEGKAFADQSLDMRLQMGVRGKMAEQFAKAGMLNNTQDALGYTGLASPLRIGGTLGNPDTSDFKALLKKIALSKASDALLDRFLGGNR